jgi:Tol biopolymer transport system component
MFTANIDGSELFEAIPYGYDVSHFDWQDDKNIIATFKNKAIGAENRSHYMFTDGEHNFKLLGEGRLNFDGHCVFAPDGTWIATDQKKTVEDGYFQSLHIYNINTKEFFTLLTHNMKKRIFINDPGDLRCDFHPRWNKTGDKICIDSISQKDGTRQIYIAYL